VAWDFVETPSQTLQNWPWEPSVITALSGHYLDPSQKIPDDMRDRLIATRDLDQGLSYARQLAQSMIDMDYHTASGPVDVNAVSNAETERITGMAPIAGNSFPATFGHIMGGYDAGYYSYMWSNVYALDCFSQFQKEGLSNQATGLRYRNAILAQGDMKDGDALLREFLGREPNSDAFFKMLNITQKKS
jgi:thimet oligopeptidase